MTTKLLASPGTKGVVDATRRTIRHVISAQIIDRDHEVLRSRGCIADFYLSNNPVVFLNHRASALPIARCLDIGTSDTTVEAVRMFAGSEQLHLTAETVFRLYKDNFLRAWSVGFQTLKDSPAPLLSGQRGRSVMDWELLEYSAVGIPSNPAAKAALVADFRTKGYLAIPDGATEADLGNIPGDLPLQKYWDVAASLQLHTGASAPETGEHHMDEKERKLISDIKGMFTEVRVHFDSEIKEVSEKVDGIGARVNSLETQSGTQKFADGTVWTLGAGRITRGAGRGEAGLSLVNVIRSLQTGDRTLAPLAADLSGKLVQSGFPQTDPRSIVLPLGDAALMRLPGHESVIDEVGRVSKQAWPMEIDAEELRVVRKQFMGANKMPMDSLDDPLGGSFILPPIQGEPILALQSATVVLQAGARSVPAGPGGSAVYPKTTGEPQMEWLPPNGTISESAVPTGALTLTPHKCAGLIKLPNELLRFSAGVGEAIVREALVSKLARTIDLAALKGQGGASPVGVVEYPLSAANTPTRDRVTQYTGAGVSTTLGNSLRAEDPLKMIAYLEEANDAEGPTGFIMRPLFWAAVANKRADSVFTGDGAGQFLFGITRGELSRTVEKILSGVPVLTTTAISKARTENNGSVTGLTYMLLGTFRQMLVANIGVVEIAVSNAPGFGSDQTWVRVIGHADVGLAHPESFVLYDALLQP